MPVCCRGTPQEIYEAKLLDILSFSNMKLAEASSDRLIHMVSYSEIQVFSKSSGSKVGQLVFQECTSSGSYLVYYAQEHTHKLACIINVYKSSKKIGFTIAESLAHL